VGPTSGKVPKGIWKLDIHLAGVDDDMKENIDAGKLQPLRLFTKEFDVGG
jgi:hypothetical protein